MHCPQCGQQQVSDDVRYCKGCGFALGAVKELLTTGGISPNEIEDSKSQLSPRRRGVRQGLILVFIALCILPLLEAFGEQWSEAIPGTLMMVGLMRMLYAWIFQKGAPSQAAQRRALTHAPPNKMAQIGPANDRVLPAAQGVSVSDFQAPRGVTKEMAAPPSVTEHTTKLLNESQNHE